MRCCVPFCKNSSDHFVPTTHGEAISFHGFPSEVHLRAAWLRALGKQGGRLPDSAVVCSQHFLNDDIFETESGVRQIRTGAIPSTVQVCMICLDTDSKLYLMSKQKLEKTYEKLTGYPLHDLGNLHQTVCIQCAQRLINFSKFRDKSLRARALMMDLIGKHELITKQHIKMINRTKHQLKSNMVLKTLGPDHCDLHIQEHPSGDKQTESEETGYRVVVKTENSDDSMSIDEDMEVKNEFDCNIHDFLQVTLEYEGTFFQCTFCLEEFVHEHAYMQHLSMHLQNGDGDGECDTSQECRPHTAVSFSHSSLITENKQADPSPCARAATTLADPLPASLASNEIKEPSTEEAVMDDSCRHKRLTECFVKLYDIFSKKVVPRRDRSLTKTQKAVRSCVSQNIASKDISYQATSQSGVLTTEHFEPVTNKEKVSVSKTMYICDFCQKTFEQRRLLVTHIRGHMLVNRFFCKLCKYKSKYKKDLVRHMRTHTSEKPYCCKLCEYKCTRNSDLVRHMRTHTGDKPYCCKLCKYKCTANSDLVRHMRTHTGEKPYCCKLCKHKSTRNNDLVRHMRTHTGEKPYCCKLCKYKCAANSALVRHMRTHTGDKPYCCKLCKYKCAANSDLVRHMRTHTSENQYYCKLCNYKCTQNCYLVRHMRTHTGDKPYCCKLCKYKCTRNSNLMRHMRTHTGEKPYYCKLCKYKCAANSALVRHMRTHTGENPYACKLCKYKCKQNSHLVRHMRTH
ncbi:histone-lysine N-methyltransferase PRDM9-like [Maniola jurtina]|uniref:histone-lysine N-methyltransferase PRDM9-like n=1 Tax=Maniola jurtina TaxID=191418 RepID=UPI001E68F7A6|nr:histone-lysine N-methyltransferase PRDM9-like [Maniola jurtina]